MCKWQLFDYKLSNPHITVTIVTVIVVGVVIVPNFKFYVDFRNILRLINAFNTGDKNITLENYLL